MYFNPMECSQLATIEDFLYCVANWSVGAWKTSWNYMKLGQQLQLNYVVGRR